METPNPEISSGYVPAYKPTHSVIKSTKLHKV